MDLTTITLSCRVCGKPQSIQAELQDLKDYTEGRKHAQTAFPYLTAAEREMIISQTCGQCWDEMFSDDEEDEQPDPDDMGDR